MQLASIRTTLRSVKKIQANKNSYSSDCLEIIVEEKTKMREYTIDKQGHTLGCMLRPRLFANGATFAACVVLHPQDKHLVMKVEAADADQCVMDAIYAATNDLDQMIREVDSFIAHNSLITEMEVVE